MSAAEMVIRLIDGTAQEQAAFDQPPQEFNKTLEKFSLDIADAQRKINTKTSPASQVNTSGDTKLGNEAPANEGYQDLRQSITELVRQFTPEIFSEPIEKLAQSLAPRNTNKPSDSATEQSNTYPAGPTVESAFNNVVMMANQVTVNGAVKSDREDSTNGQSQPKSESSKPGKFAEFRKSIVKRIESTRIGKVAMRAARGVRPIVRSAGRSIARSRFGKAAAGVGRRVAASSIGRSVASMGASVTGSGAAAGAGTAAAGGTAVAAGGAVAGVAAVAAPVAVAVASIGALAVAAKLGGDALLSMAGDLSELSGPLASEKARGQMNTELNMIDRAQKLGPGLGQISSANNRFNDASEKLLTQTLALLLKFAPAIEVGADTLTAIVSAMDVGLKSLDRLYTLATPGLGDNQPAIDALNGSIAKLQEAFGDIFKNNDNDDYKELQREFENFLKMDAPKKREDK